MLSKREIEILNLVKLGLTNAEIGQKLYIDRFTARNHMTNILRKLKARSRAHAVYLALKIGVIG